MLYVALAEVSEIIAGVPNTSHRQLLRGKHRKFEQEDRYRRKPTGGLFGYALGGVL